MLGSICYIISPMYFEPQIMYTKIMKFTSLNKLSDGSSVDIYTRSMREAVVNHRAWHILPGCWAGNPFGIIPVIITEEE